MFTLLRKALSDKEIHFLIYYTFHPYFLRIALLYLYSPAGRKAEHTTKRRMIMKQQLASLALVAAIVTGGVASAHAFEGTFDGCDGPRAEHKMNPQKRIDRMAKELKLSPSQKDQIGAIMMAEQQQVEPLRQKMGEGHKQIQSVVHAATFDESAVRAIAAEQAKISTELLVSRARAMSQVNALLTPEQRELVQKFRDSRPGKHGRKGHRPPKG
jgi:Spy/CpxP family protein refolding chaperone